MHIGDCIYIYYDTMVVVADTHFDTILNSLCESVLMAILALDNAHAQNACGYINIKFYMNSVKNVKVLYIYEHLSFNGCVRLKWRCGRLLILGH